MTPTPSTFFRGSEPRTNATLVTVQWFDNPWFTEELDDDRIRDYVDDPEMAEHVWGGGYEIISQGSYFAKRIAEAEKDGRVGFFPHIPALPVYTALGHRRRRLHAHLVLSDTPPRGPQPAGAGDRLLRGRQCRRRRDHHGGNAGIQQGLAVESGGLRRAGPGRALRSTAGTSSRTTSRSGSGAAAPRAGSRSSIRSASRSPRWHLGVAQDPEERIAATRALLPICEFHQSKRVMHGLSRLRRYSRKINEALGVYMGPLHDENSATGPTPSASSPSTAGSSRRRSRRNGSRRRLRASFGCLPCRCCEPGRIVL